jgi:hypothetical protein
VGSFTLRPLYPRCPLDRKLGGPQSRSGRFGEEKILDSIESRFQPLDRPARSQSLYRLSYPGSTISLSEQLNIAPIELVFSVVTPSCTVSEENTASVFRVEVNVITQIHERGRGDGALSKP